MTRAYQIAPDGSTRSNAPRRDSPQSKIASMVTAPAICSESAAKLLLEVVPPSTWLLNASNPLPPRCPDRKQYHAKAAIFGTFLSRKFCRLARQRPSVHPVGCETKMPQHRRRDIDQRRTPTPYPGHNPAAGDEQERALLVAAEPAMLAEAGAVFRFERVANDVAVAGHAVWIGAVVGPEG